MKNFEIELTTKLQEQYQWCITNCSLACSKVAVTAELSNGRCLGSMEDLTHYSHMTTVENQKMSLIEPLFYIKNQSVFITQSFFTKCI